MFMRPRQKCVLSITVSHISYSKYQILILHHPCVFVTNIKSHVTYAVSVDISLIPLSNATEKYSIIIQHLFSTTLPYLQEKHLQTC